MCQYCLSKCFTLTLLLLIWPGSAGAGKEDTDYTGRWYITLTGQRYVMDLTQRGFEIQGFMIPLDRNKQQINIIAGRANGKLIELRSNNKDLSITYHFKGALIGTGKEQALIGSFVKNNHHYNQWHALRYERRSYYGSPDMIYSIFHNFDTPPNPF